MVAADPILRALDRVHAVLRAGRYGELDALTTEIEAAMRGLPDMAPATLDAVRRKAGRNAACLAASMLGLKSARRRIAEIIDIQGGKGTYDSRGRRDAPGSPTGRLSARL